MAAATGTVDPPISAMEITAEIAKFNKLQDMTKAAKSTVALRYVLVAGRDRYNDERFKSITSANQKGILCNADGSNTTVGQLQRDSNWQTIDIEHSYSSTNPINCDKVEAALTAHWWQFREKNQLLNLQRGGGSCAPNRIEMIKQLTHLHAKKVCTDINASDLAKGYLKRDDGEETRAEIVSHLGQTYVCTVTYNLAGVTDKYMLRTMIDEDNDEYVRVDVDEENNE
jgi:hypothetical protein